MYALVLAGCYGSDADHGGSSESQDGGDSDLDIAGGEPAASNESDGSLGSTPSDVGGPPLQWLPGTEVCGLTVDEDGNPVMPTQGLDTDCDPAVDHFIAMTVDGESLRFEGCDQFYAWGALQLNSDYENSVQLSACANDVASDLLSTVSITDSNREHGFYDWSALGAPGYVGNSDGRIEWGVVLSAFNLDSVRIQYTKFEPVGGVIAGMFSGILQNLEGEFQVCRYPPLDCDRVVDAARSQ